MNRRLPSLLPLFLAAIVAVKSALPHDFESEIRRLDSLNTSAFRLAIDTLYFELDCMNNPEIQKTYSTRIFAITQARDAMAHIRSLAYPTCYPDSIRRQYLNEAFAIARKNKSIKEMAWVEERRCRYHLEKGRYDSAMVYILRFRDAYRTAQNSEDYLNVEHLLGDIYYRARLYEKAECIYQNILDEYDKNKRWDFWRPYVIMNNMGLIGIRREDYPSALRWFNRSLETASVYLTIPEKENIRAYILIKLSEVSQKTGRIDLAEGYLSQAESISRNQLSSDVLEELLFWKSHLMLARGDIEAAHALAQELEAYGTRLTGARFDTELDLLFSKIYQQLGDSPASLRSLKKYAEKKDDLDNQKQITRSLLILAEKDYEITREELKASHQDKIYLAAILCIILPVLTVVGVRYSHSSFFRQQANPKNRRKRETEKYRENPVSAWEQTGELAGLADQLQELVIRDKIYLDPELSIQKVAHSLSTNRTYLSMAINQQFNMNFPSYINRLRIQESIRLISEGFASTLTLEALARQSGFTSRTVFLTAFKKETCVPPSTYIKKYNTTN